MRPSPPPDTNARPNQPPRSGPRNPRDARGPERPRNPKSPQSASQQIHALGVRFAWVRPPHQRCLYRKSGSRKARGHLLGAQSEEVERDRMVTPGAQVCRTSWPPWKAARGGLPAPALGRLLPAATWLSSAPLAASPATATPSGQYPLLRGFTAFLRWQARRGRRDSKAVLALARRRVNVIWALLRDGRATCQCRPSLWRLDEQKQYGRACALSPASHARPRACMALPVRRARCGRPGRSWTAARVSPPRAGRWRSTPSSATTAQHGVNGTRTSQTPHSGRPPRDVVRYVEG